MLGGMQIRGSGPSEHCEHCYILTDIKGKGKGMPAVSDLAYGELILEERAVLIWDYNHCGMEFGQKTSECQIPKLEKKLLKLTVPAVGGVLSFPSLAITKSFL